MTNLIAIYGSTCSEKTETARELSRMTGNMVMHPGEAITTRAKADKLGGGKEVGDATHREVDENTRALAENLKDLMIFESSQLDAVLGPRDDIFYVRLHARDDVRESRWNHQGVAKQFSPPVWKSGRMVTQVLSVLTLAGTPRLIAFQKAMP